MSEKIRWEVGAWVQYAALTLVAGVLTFWGALPGGRQTGEYAEAVNIGEAWKNYAPVLRSWLLIFLLLTAARLAVVYLIYRRRKGK
ncbi:MAG TPA: hypothetical protein VF297_24450 [Pyrinomonadaceae bacterium]